MGKDLFLLVYFYFKPIILHLCEYWPNLDNSKNLLFWVKNKIIY